MSGLKIGRIIGIEIYLHSSWLVIAALIMWSLASAALPADFPAVAVGARVAMAAGITLLFFLSLLVHELAHSVVAVTRGIPVHRITFFLFGGMAETSTDSRSPGEEFYIAIAGPAASFLLAGLFFALWYLGQGQGWSPLVVGSAAYIGALNLVLGVFNMLPGFPMDGGRVLRAVIWKATGSVTRATRWASVVGAGMAWLLIAYGVWEVVTGDMMGGIWLVFIGWFIRHAARASYRQHLMARIHEEVQARVAEQEARGLFGHTPPGRDVTELNGGR
jgi:Zn-dependent protease